MDTLNQYRNKKVLVTGAAGYIGAPLTERLVALKAEVVTLTRKPFPLKGTVNCVGDIRESGKWTEWVGGAEIIFHLAAQTNAKVAEKDPKADWEINCASFNAMLDGCARLGHRPSIILASSVTLFGKPAKLPVDDAAPSNPPSVYEKHKLENERALWQAQQAGNVRGAALRLANVYGPSVSTTVDGRGILNWMMGQAIEGKKLTIFGSGDWRRDYVFLDDVVEAFLLAGLKKEYAFRHYQVSTGVGNRFQDVVQGVVDLARAATGIGVSIEHDESAVLSEVDRRDFIGNPNRFYDLTGWKPTVSLENGLQRLRDFLLKDASCPR